MHNRSHSHLICNAQSPLISSGKLQEELILYNLSPESIQILAARFASLTQKQITPDSDLAALSGGQKVLLMCLLALHSPASQILFLDLWHSLDSHNVASIKDLIREFASAKKISFEESAHED